MITTDPYSPPLMAPDPSATGSGAGDHARVLPVQVYTPEPFLNHPGKLFCELAHGVWSGRELAWRLFVRDLTAMYRQTYLGYVWAFLPPLIAALTFVFLHSQGLFQTGATGVPYAAFAMMGTLLWQVFVDALNSPGSSLAQAKPMLSKINFPREAILVGGVYMVVFNFSIRLLLLIGVLLYFQVSPGISLLFFPVTVLALIACGMAFGMALAPIGSLYGDIGRSIPMITGFWMLLTPVVYPAKTEGLAGFLATWNPVSPLIITARQSLTGGELTHLGPFFIVVAGSCVVLFLGWIGFRIAMPHLIARMGG